MERGGERRGGRGKKQEREGGGKRERDRECVCVCVCVCVTGWYLSMKPEDSFVRRLQPLRDIPLLMERNNRFGTFNDKTLGMLLVSGWYSCFIIVTIIVVTIIDIIIVFVVLLLLLLLFLFLLGRR